ncbi:M48 family metalloprotease [Marinobacterium rhizophilum]|uniref:Putative beta-barrel assembly-enhancing protease n=1 Tax=Marinobacterium rhizophilum TaxID=420402 RepID=A0ABY5HR49_9GAMM|nr:M48 family metalloprotease [Marinobacterium rhizophilum]UTW13697.1 M48 family metallopeptidase [Marinobacterium rhizophilum]
MLASKILPPLLLGFLLSATATSQAAQSLPTIGDTSSSIVSLQQEARLGDTWSRMLRGRAKLLEDPIVYGYLEDLLWRLAGNSALSQPQLDLITVDNPTLNAFAVPGGVIGVHGGLLLSAEAEDELASVLAHELAHLSQRHFAQQLEQERRNRPFMMAAVLGSILVAAADPQAGAAALTSTLGAGELARLSFSRQNEQEADRLGMATLASSGIDPDAMPRMFERMQRSMRFYGDRPPEFLLTHPVTQSRIADALNRAAQLPTPNAKQSSPEFDIARARLQVHYASRPGVVLEAFEAAAQQSGTSRDHYGVAMAASAAGDYTRALQALDKLNNDWKRQLYVRISRAEILHAAGRNTDAEQILAELNQLYPNNLPVQKTYARLLQDMEEPARAARLYESLLIHHPNDIDSRFNLAESYGLNGQILRVHEARIEYFLRTADVDSALRQVDFALKEKNLSESDRARLETYKQDAEQLREDLKMEF